MASTRVTPLHQEMAAGERDEGEIALQPKQQLDGQGRPDAELNNCSGNGSIFGESKSIQEEKVKSKESVIEPAWQISGVRMSSPKGEREDDCLREKLMWLSGLFSSMTNLPGFGILLAILCVLWGQV